MSWWIAISRPEKLLTGALLSLSETYRQSGAVAAAGEDMAEQLYAGQAAGFLPGSCKPGMRHSRECASRGGWRPDAAVGGDFGAVALPGEMRIE